MKHKFKLILMNFLIFLTILLVFATNWFLSTFDELSLDEIIFHLKVPMKGSNSDFLVSFIQKPLSISVILFLSVILLYHFAKNKNDSLDVLIRKNQFFVSIPIILLFALSLNYTVFSLGVPEYLRNNVTDSTLYDDFYVKSDKDLLAFPEEQRNLIYIFVESYEATFTSKEYGGALEENTLYKMIDFTNEHVHFSDTEKIGGAASAVGTTWTVGGMVAQTSGIHLKLPIDGNSYGAFEHFLPGVVSIGDLLSEQGYNQTLLLGSDANFGGRSDYFSQHGNYVIKDYIYALQTGLIPEDYSQWWGFEDEKLFEFAKKELLDLADQGKPFNLTMLTADSHHVGGYVTEGMETPFDEQYKNVLLNSSKQLFDFISWVQEQEFYENTTIVVSGDHNTMDAEFIERNVDQNYHRRIFNVIINSTLEAENKHNRDFATFDFFPTTLASMGVQIEGERLGIGTNLFSNRETIFEELGFEEVNEQLSRRSKFYSNNILISE